MRTIKTLIICAVALVLAGSVAMAMKHLPEERGMKHFKNSNFAGGSKSCNACHPNGSGLERAGAKSKFNIMGGTQNSLKEAVNFCIVNANKGKAIDENSDQMNEIVSYIKSIGKPRGTPGYGKSPGYGGAPGYGKSPGYGKPK